MSEIADWGTQKGHNFLFSKKLRKYLFILGHAKIGDLLIRKKNV
jgi:hypothetical protein